MANVDVTSASVSRSQLPSGFALDPAVVDVAADRCVVAVVFVLFVADLELDEHADAVSATSTTNVAHESARLTNVRNDTTFIELAPRFRMPEVDATHGGSGVALSSPRIARVTSGLPPRPRRQCNEVGSVVS